jgi:hypothetical protein
VGTVCASTIHGTVDAPGAGSENVGALMVYVYTHGALFPEQSVYVQVYVFVPEHTGSGPTTGPVGVIGIPQLSKIDGGVGTTCALTIHGTVDPPLAGNVKVEGFTV